MSIDTETCVFCDIINGDAPAEVVAYWSDAMAIVPLNPVTFGHTLIIPRTHVGDFAEDPLVTALVMGRAAELAGPGGHFADCNLITSRGPNATQTVFHLHVHLVPRRPDDGLHLPWTDQADIGTGVRFVRLPEPEE